MPPAASAVKPPFPQLWLPKKDRNRLGPAFINFDAMGGGRSPQSNIPLGSYLVLICPKPLYVFSPQDDRDTYGRMIVKCVVVV